MSSATERDEILIAEDSATQAAQLRFLLEERGFTVTVAADGQLALERLRSVKPALVISDIVMPRMDGFALCKAIKSDDALRDIPVILVTSLSGVHDVMKGLECGADNFIRKPYEAKYLLARVDYLLMNQQLRKGQKMQMGVEIILGGRKHFITAERQQIVDLLISIYEGAVQLNEELKVRERELAHSNQSLSGLYRIAVGLNGASTEREVAAQALERALELPGIRAGWITLHDEHDGFRIAGTLNLPPALEAPGALDGDCLCRRQLLSGALAKTTELVECERLTGAAGRAERPQFHTSIPLWIGDRRLGIMNLLGGEGASFDEDDLKTLHGVGNQVAIALERARLYEHLETLVEQRTAALTEEIEERRRAEAEIRKLSSAVEKAADSIFITGADGVIQYVNPSFERITGYSREEALGKTPRILKSDRHDAAYYRNLWSTLVRGEVYRDVFINRRKDGRLYYEEVTITPLTGEGDTITHYVSTGKDITERMQTEERLHYLAHHDLLTDLPNRLLFMDHLNQALNRAQRDDHGVGVLIVDLDRFKLINDTLGHEPGDAVLRAMAKRLRRSMRDGDTVARFGGDEFAVLLDDVASPDDVAAKASSLLEVLAEPETVNGREVFITASIGIGFFPNDGADVQTLMKNADAAVHRAKQRGGNLYQFYHADMNARALERLTLECDLRRALEKKEFELHYQPQVDLLSGCVIGSEALIRWRRGDADLVSPMHFIPLLEETGLILPVGDWILDSACRQQSNWCRGGMPLRHVAVNITAKQFENSDLIETVRRAMAATGLARGCLELEITESDIMENAEAVVKDLYALREMGVRIAIDDFGTGYSSLSYLKRFPIDILKIDQSFVRDITLDPDDAAIVSAIITMAHTLGIQVVAEGVETREQIDFLRRRGCDFIQGYYFSRPRPAEDMQHVVHDVRLAP